MERGSAQRKLRVVVEGCCHGELDAIYASVERMQQQTGQPVDLLICCGDFQAVRNRGDLRCMNVPPKYLTMASFHKYYSGSATAPVLTIFVGGNHEASNHLQELYYGGWVAPNIYYLGCSGVIRYGGVRIAGISGIYSARDYRKGHHESPPYSASSIRSIYHQREFEIFKLAQIQEELDVMVSHDWPRAIYHHGDLAGLLKRKPFFRKECETNELGSPPGQLLLTQVKPRYWFAGHLHCKFAALVRHDNARPRTTKFLALDKCLPNRDFLQLVELPRPPWSTGTPVLEYDIEWLAVLKATHPFLTRSESMQSLPAQTRLVGAEEKEWIRSRILGQTPGESFSVFEIPKNFARTARVYDPSSESDDDHLVQTLEGNPQTDALLSLLQLPHKVTVPSSADRIPSTGQAPFFLDRGNDADGRGLEWQDVENGSHTSSG